MRDRLHILGIESSKKLAAKFEELIDTKDFLYNSIKVIGPDDLVNKIKEINPDLILLNAKQKDILAKALKKFENQEIEIPTIVYFEEEPVDQEKLLEHTQIWYVVSINQEKILLKYLEKFKSLKETFSYGSENPAFSKIRRNYYDLIAGNAREGIVIIQEGKLVYLDPQISHFLDHDNEILKSRPFIDFIHPDDTSMVMEMHMKRLGADEKIKKYRFRVVSNSGEYVWLETDGIKIDWNGKEATLNFVTEITEQVESELLLRTSEEKYKGVVRSSPDGILMLDTSGKILDLNDSFLEMSGGERSDFSSKHISECSDQEIIEQIKPGINGLLSGTFLSLDPIEVSTKKDGEDLSIEVYIRPLFAEEETSGILIILRDVTRSNLAHKKITESERRYRELHKNMLDAVVAVDFEGKILENNESFRKLSGYSENDLSGKILTSIISEGWKESEEDIRNNQVLKRGHSDAFELELIKSSGSVVPVEVHCYLRQPQENDHGGLWYFFRDITQRKKYENELIEREMQLKTVLEYFPIPLIEEDLSFIRDTFKELKKNGVQDLAEYFNSDPEALKKCCSHVRLLYSNQGALQFFGVENIEQLDAYYLYPSNEELLKSRIAMMEAFWRGDRVYEEETVFVTQSGHRKNGIIKSVILPGKERSWDTVLVSIVDFSERIQTDKQIRVLSQAIASSPISVLITNTDGDIEYVNPKFTEVSGYTLEEVFSKKPSILKSGKTPSKVYEELWSKITTGGEWTGEIQNKKKNGDLFWEQASISAVKNEKGEVTHFVAIKEDITERKLTENELLSAKLKAEEADRLKTAFLANMSHEIRTPMNAIVGFSEILRTSEVSGTEREEYFNIINNSCNTLSNLIDDIIDLAKIEAGQTTIAEDLCKPYEVMKELQIYFEEEGNKSGKPVKVILDTNIDAEIVIKADEFRLRQVLSNLLGNAIKFTHKGFITWGCALERTKYLKFYVKDTGIGIPKSNLEIIFDRFRQMDGSSIRKYGGTGLGLPVSKSLVELMGGEIWVESQEGRGSEFFFTLPFKQVDEVVFDSSELADEQKSGFHWKDRVILIVEDNLSNFEFIKAVLSKTRAKIYWAETGVKAIELFKKKKNIDIVLMDIQIPELDGYEATRMMKKMKPNIPVIAQTAYAMSHDREKAMEVGCDDYISKPIKPLDLLNLMSKYL